MNTSKPNGRTRPFRTEPILRTIPSYQLRPEDLIRALSGKTSWSGEAFIRLWLTEGPPEVFRECPDVWEDLRSWLANRLQICPKDITIVGSARLGFSLSPPPKYGSKFGKDSDLDLALIDTATFEQFRQGFFLWVEEYANGSVSPRNETERKHWEANRDGGRGNFARGFFDANKLPNFPHYAIARHVNNAMWALTEKLRVTPSAPVPRKVSARIYKDWQSLVERVRFNLRNLLRQRTA